VGLLYFDASALVTMLTPTIDRAKALRQWTDEFPESPWVTSVLGEFELWATVHAHARSLKKNFHRQARAVSSQVRVLPLPVALGRYAPKINYTGQKGADALHIAIAAHYHAELSMFVSYDRAQLMGAAAQGLPIIAPGREDLLPVG
jgi:predicted nucleic acid-binding protein